MTFISYAQNREDVMLWRALQAVPQGFYVDVGANDPSDDSVTRAFYERGWSGINIEPLSSHMTALQRDRPRDINLCVAAGATDGEVEIFDTPVRGWATASVSVAQLHQASGVTLTACTVPMRRLDSILAEFAPPAIHFLKIDVEGFEESVLRGIDLTRWRPWVVVVEATVPTSDAVDTHWEPLLTQAAYACVYFDGLNKYYLAQEHADLKAAFAAPPNVFDDFVAAEHARLQQALAPTLAELHGLQAQIQQERRVWQAKLAEAQKNLELQHHQAVVAAQQAQAQIESLDARLNAVFASTSWRVTRPLRLLARLAARLRPGVARQSGTLPTTTADGSMAASRDFSLLPDISVRTGSTVYWNPGVLRDQPWFSAMAGGADQDARDMPALNWRVVGHVEGHYSLAIVNRGLALALDNLAPGRVRVVAYHGQPCASVTDLPAHQAADLQRLMAHELPADAPVVSLVHHYPLITDADPAACRLALFFWEESAVPADMVARLNASFDAVVVASSFVRWSLRNSGCSLPIVVVPPGVADFATRVPARAEVLRPRAGQSFRFLHVSSAFDRKGVDTLLEAFYARFGKNDAVELYIKTFANPHNTVATLLAKLKTAWPDGPRVVLDESDLDEVQMGALYASAHAMVLPSRGEGFNMPAAEAMALGVPLVVSGFGGHADFADCHSAYLVPFCFAPSASHLHTDGSFWVEPDQQALSELLGMVHADVLAQDAGLSQRCQRAAERIRKNYQWRHAALALGQAAQGRLTLQPKNAAVQPVRVAVLSPWNTACGIAQHAQPLLAGWESSFELRVFCDQRTPADDAQQVYTPSWALGDELSVCKTLDMIGEQGFQVLLVQHQQSLFLLSDRVCEALARVKARGCVLVLELHSTLPLVRERRISAAAAAVLRSLDRVLVHKLDDVNYLLGLGLADNVMCLPLGVTLPEVTGSVPDIRQALGLQPQDLVLGCFGFLLPHKGLDGIIGGMPALAAATGRPVKLLAVTAALDARSRETLAECQQLAKSLGVAQQIIWMTDFLPMPDCLRFLTAVDVMVYAYGPTRESASAAVTVGLATGKPVLVSDQPIFSNVQGCTQVMRGGGTEGLVGAVMGLLNDPTATAALTQRQAQWLTRRSWPRVSSQFRSVVEGLLQDQPARGDRVSGLAQTQHGQRQLLVDVSELYFRNAHTGIQRVVMNILQVWLDHPPAGVTVRPVYSDGSAVFKYTNKFFTTPGDAATVMQDETPVHVTWGDVFLGLDLSAHLFPAAESSLARFRLAGVRVVYVVYDIIPLLRPDFSVPGMDKAFAQWLHSLRRQADCLMCISEAVANDVRLWLGGHTAEGALPEVTAFHLGADFAPAHNSTAATTMAAPVLAAIGTEVSFLMVGTLEPRKGYRQVLEAFELLWASGAGAALVVVGKPGWMMDDFGVRLHQHPELGKRLFWLEQADDATLDLLYQQCSCLLAASELEGFGLPLVEAARHRLPILARDIRVFREVAGDHAAYFQGLDAASLCEALRQWITMRQLGQVKSSAAMPYLSWSQSANALLKAVL